MTTAPNDKSTDATPPAKSTDATPPALSEDDKRAVATADRKRDEKEKLRDRAREARADFSTVATHVMMWHPRSPGSKNFPVLCKRDDGNGSGLFVTEQGEALEVVRAHDDDGKLLAVERRDERIVRSNVVSVLLR